MSQEQFSVLMTYVSTDLVEMIAEKENKNNEEAVRMLYNSHLYAMLEKEDTKLWQYSTHMLYSLFQQEQKFGTITFPEV